MLLQKSSPNRVVDDVKTKSESSKKSPNKEKKEEKVKAAEKPKERVPEPKAAKKEAPLKGKKGKAVEGDKPADFDDGLWQEVPKKSDKKKVKSPEEKKEAAKKESPARKGKKAKEVEKDVEAAHPAEEPVEEVIKVLSAVGPDVDENAAKALQAQVEELQRILNEVCSPFHPRLSGRDH